MWEQLHEREKDIMELQRTLDDKDKELHAIRLDHEVGGTCNGNGRKLCLLILDTFLSCLSRVPMLLIAILDVVVGSEAIITWTLFIIKQCSSLGCFPSLKIIHIVMFFLELYSSKKQKHVIIEIACHGNKRVILDMTTLTMRALSREVHSFVYNMLHEAFGNVK
uniref:K+ potassium transporter integral membrane domain-containing protein n=1 Tax=Lactuca sativa TaxID=4236 RepID=A0A9R1UU88_LACSA|nr:hypothetical protein LSAT_V11C800406840 [Lactuca sativa]